MVRPVATALLACLLLLAPAAAASKRSEVRRYGAALHAYAKAEGDAALASAPAYRARRDAVAAGCLDVVRDGARQQLIAVVVLYHLWAAKPLVEAAQPAADRFVRRLGRTPTRSRTLRRARRAHSRRHRDYARIPALLPADLCAELSAWQAAGWSAAATPAGVEQVDAVEAKVHERDDAAIARGARFLRRHGVSARAADVFLRGTADGYDSLFAGDPVIQAIEDAVNS
jgi:hypothetical protein